MTSPADRHARREVEFNDKLARLRRACDDAAVKLTAVAATLTPAGEPAATAGAFYRVGDAFLELGTALLHVYGGTTPERSDGR